MHPWHPWHVVLIGCVSLMRSSNKSMTSPFFLGIQKASFAYFLTGKWSKCRETCKEVHRAAHLGSQKWLWMLSAPWTCEELRSFQGLQTLSHTWGVFKRGKNYKAELMGCLHRVNGATFSCIPKSSVNILISVPIDRVDNWSKAF